MGNSLLAVRGIIHKYIVVGGHTMGHYTVILTFGVLSFMGWYGSVFTTKRIIQQSGLHKKYWPKRYIMPNRKIRRLYCLKKREIPKWCYYQILLSFVYIALFVISSLLCLLVNKPFIAQLLMWIYCIIMALDLLYIMVCSFIYKK